jgi:hypothetical protein
MPEYATSSGSQKQKGRDQMLHTVGRDGRDEEQSFGGVSLKDIQ